MARFARRLLLLIVLLSVRAWAAPSESNTEQVAPKGFVVMTVVGLLPSPMGNAVLLTDPAESLIVPIFVGDSEALVIGLRAERQRYQRPLTHDLLDEVLEELDGEIDQVRIDDLRSGTFVATVYLRKGSKVSKIDSRASDAIAIALGHGKPIYVAQKVVDEAKVRAEDLVPERGPSTPGSDPL